jgi:hypothetical protein
MNSSLDLAIVNSLPALTKLQALALAAIKHHENLNALSNRPTQPSRTPNLAELFLVATRSGTRLAFWLQSELPKIPEVFTASDVLKLRIEFGQLLDKQAHNGPQALIVPVSKSAMLATYLAVTPCPTVSSLSNFAGIRASRARVWLRRLAQASIINGHSRPNELLFLNTLLVSRLVKLSPERLKVQFDVTVSRPDWPRRSVYRTIT